MHVTFGRAAAGAEFRRGDPDTVSVSGDALDFEHTYTSGVIACAPEDRPADAQIEAVLDECGTLDRLPRSAFAAKIRQALACERAEPGYGAQWAEGA